MSFEFLLKTPHGTIKVSGATQKELFKALSDAQEVFAEPNCGKCGKTDLRFRTRVVDDNTYQEMQCVSCGAILAFGQSKQNPGSLFPKRKLLPNGKPDLKKGTYDVEGRGWTMYRGKVDDE